MPQTVILGPFTRFPIIFPFLCANFWCLWHKSVKIPNFNYVHFGPFRTISDLSIQRFRLSRTILYKNKLVWTSKIEKSLKMAKKTGLSKSIYIYKTWGRMWSRVEPRIVLNPATRVLIPAIWKILGPAWPYLRHIWHSGCVLVPIMRKSVRTGFNVK